MSRLDTTATAVTRDLAFGTGLGDADKMALLEYLKTLTPLTGSR